MSARERFRTALLFAELYAARVTEIGMLKRREGDVAPPAVAPRSGEWQGRDEAAAWLGTLDLTPLPHWHVEASLDAGAGTKFNLNVYAEEWGFAFHHTGRSSWIRVTDIAFVHGQDDFGLIERVPALLSLNAFITNLELEYAFKLPRSSATIRSNVSRATAVVRQWLSRASTRARRPSNNGPCDDEMHDGIRCTLERGHEGHHAFESSEGALRWKQRSDRG